MADQCVPVYSSQLVTNANTDFTVITRTITRDPTTTEEVIPQVTTTCPGCLLPPLCPLGCTTSTDYQTNTQVIPGATSLDVITSPVATRVAVITQLIPVSMDCPSGANPPPLPTAVLTSLPNGAEIWANTTSRGRGRSSSTAFSTQVVVVTVNGAPMTTASIVPVVQPDDSNGGGGSSIGAIAGGVVGGLVGLFILGIVIVVWQRQRSRKREESDLLCIGAGERIEDDLWKPEKRHTIRVIADAFDPNAPGAKGDDRSDDDAGGLSRGSTILGDDRKPALPNIEVPDDDEVDEQYAAVNHRLSRIPTTSATHLPLSAPLPPGMGPPSPYGPMPAPYGGAPYPYSTPAPYSYPTVPYTSAYPPPPPPPVPVTSAGAFEGGATIRRASTRMSMYGGAAPNRQSMAITTRNPVTGGEDEPFSPSATTAVNRRKSYAAGEVHRREKSNGWSEER